MAVEPDTGLFDVADTNAVSDVAPDRQLVDLVDSADEWGTDAELELFEVGGPETICDWDYEGAFSYQVVKNGVVAAIPDTWLTYEGAMVSSVTCAVADPTVRKNDCSISDFLITSQDEVAISLRVRSYFGSTIWGVQLFGTGFAVGLPDGTSLTSSSGPKAVKLVLSKEQPLLLPVTLSGDPSACLAEAGGCLVALDAGASCSAYIRFLQEP